MKKVDCLLEGRQRGSRGVYIVWIVAKRPVLSADIAAKRPCVTAVNAVNAIDSRY